MERISFRNKIQAWTHIFTKIRNIYKIYILNFIEKYKLKRISGML